MTSLELDASRFVEKTFKDHRYRPGLSLAAAGEAGEPELIRISLGAYLRSIWTLFWTAFLHPFTTTVIDLTSGKRLAELSIPYQEWEARLYNQGSEEPVNG